MQQLSSVEVQQDLKNSHSDKYLLNVINIQPLVNVVVSGLNYSYEQN